VISGSVGNKLHEFTPVLSGVRVTRSLVLCVCFVDRCLSFCPFFFWPLCCLFFNIQILITSLVSSNSFYIMLTFYILIVLVKRGNVRCSMIRQQKVDQGFQFVRKLLLFSKCHHWVGTVWNSMRNILNKIWYDLEDHDMAPKQWISIRNIIIYLETKFCPNRRIFVFWRP
jgi:hypothetical protein